MASVRGPAAGSVVLASENGGASTLFHDIEAQKRQALDVARAAITSAEIARWDEVQASRVQYSALLLIADLLVIGLRAFLPGFTDWSPGLVFSISACEVMLVGGMLVAARMASFDRRWVSDAVTLFTYLFTALVVPGVSVLWSGSRPGSFSLFVLTLLVFAFPKAFVIPAAYADAAFGITVTILISFAGFQVFATGLAYEIVANTAIVLVFALAAFLPQRRNQAIRRVLVRLFATMEMESHTQLLLLQRVIPRVFLTELIKDERIVSTARRVAVLFCEVMAPDPTQGEGLHKLGNNLQAETLKTLSRVFKVIDGVMDRHGVFKVETIGSEYMAVSGLPVQCLHPRNPVFALVRASIDMLDAVHDDPLCRAKGITLQVGINAGTTVEAILGRRLLPRWKLFGDTVNTASRMKSAGTPGVIHISASARNMLLGDVRGFCAVAEPGLVSFANADLGKHGLIDTSELSEADIGHGARRMSASSVGSDMAYSPAGERAFADGVGAESGPSASLSGLDGMWGPWPSDVQTHDLKGAKPTEAQLVPAVDGVDRAGTTSVRPGWADVLLARLGGLALVPRTTIWCKGKGVMQTFVVDLTASSMLRSSSTWHGRDVLPLRRRLRRYLLALGKVSASRSVAIESLAKDRAGAPKKRATPIDQSANVGQMRMLKQVSQIALVDEKARNHRSRLSMRNRLRKHRSRPRFSSMDMHAGADVTGQVAKSSGRGDPAPSTPVRAPRASQVAPAGAMGPEALRAGRAGVTGGRLGVRAESTAPSSPLAASDRLRRFSSDPGMARPGVPEPGRSGPAEASARTGQSDRDPDTAAADDSQRGQAVPGQPRVQRGSMFMSSVLASRAGVGLVGLNGEVGTLDDRDEDQVSGGVSNSGSGSVMRRAMSGGTFDTVASAVGHAVSGASRSHSFVFGARAASSAHQPTVQVRSMGRPRPSLPSMRMGASAARPAPSVPGAELRAFDPAELGADAIVEESGDEASEVACAASTGPPSPPGAMGETGVLPGREQPGTGALMAWPASGATPAGQQPGALPSLLRGTAVPVRIDQSASTDIGEEPSGAVGFAISASPQAGTGATSGGVPLSSSKSFLRAMHSSFESGDVGASTRHSVRASAASRATVHPAASPEQRRASTTAGGRPAVRRIDPGQAATPTNTLSPGGERARFDGRMTSEAAAGTMMRSMREAQLQPQPLPRPEVKRWSLDFKGGSDVLEPLYQAHHAAHAVHQFPIGIAVLAAVSGCHAGLLLQSDPVGASLHIVCAAALLSTLWVGMGRAPHTVRAMFGPEGTLFGCRPRATLDLAEEFIQANKSNEGVSSLVAQLIHGKPVESDILAVRGEHQLSASASVSVRSGSRAALSAAASTAPVAGSSPQGRRHCGGVEPDTLVDGVLHFAALQALSGTILIVYSLAWALVFLRPWGSPPLSANGSWVGAQPNNGTEIFQLQAGQLLVLALAPALLGMRAVVLQVLAIVVAALGVAASIARPVEGWPYGAAWVVFCAGLSVFLVRDLEASRRVDFFTNYVAREGQRITEGMLHAMLPKEIADSMLNRAGTMRALARLTNDILDKSRPCGGCADRAIRRCIARGADAPPSRRPRHSRLSSHADEPHSRGPTLSEGAAGTATLGLREARNSSASKGRVVAGVGVPDDIAEALGTDTAGGCANDDQAAVSSGPGLLNLPNSRLHTVGSRHVSKGPQSMHEPSMTKVAMLMFDLVGFTKLSQEIGPHKLVTMLDQLYDIFDKMVERRGAYKVETIGDAFLVCCGAPVQRPAADSAVRVTKCALDMMQRVSSFKAPGGRSLKARVGIHIGAVLTGVIGTQMPRYQLFGPQVDYVMEMESSSEPGMVHASAELLHLIRDAPDLSVDRVLEDGTGFVSRNRAARLYMPW